MERLLLLFEGLVPSDVIQSLWDYNANLPDPLRIAKTGLDAANWALLRLEDVRIGELSLDQKLKLQALQDLKQQFQQEYERLSRGRPYVFYMGREL